MKKTAVIALAMMLMMTVMLTFSGCKLTDPEDNYYTETTESVDENGVTHTVIRKYPKETGEKTRDPMLYRTLIFTGIIFTAMSAYFAYRAAEVNRLKQRCTESVTATVIRIRNNRFWDRTLRFRYSMFNADYSYVYNGMPTEGTNQFYGREPFQSFCSLQEGDTVTVKVDPNSPRTVYDSFANDLLRYFIFECAFLALAAAANFVAYIIL